MAYDIDAEGNYDWLRLSFTPDAIREHFDVGDTYATIVEGMTDEELAEVGEFALGSPVLYKIFHELLVAGVDDVVADNDKES